MDYDTFAYLRDLLDAQSQKLEQDFRTACRFIPEEVYKPKQKSGIEKAHQIYSKEEARLHQMQSQLKAAAIASHKDNPNLEVRKFWGLPI